VRVVPAPPDEVQAAILSAQSSAGPEADVADARGSDLVLLDARRTTRSTTCARSRTRRR
jgi:hypothetical protein